MDMQTLRLECRENDRVRHVPAASGNADDPLCQDGTISRFTQTQVLVKFDDGVARTGWDDAPEVECDPETLRVL